MAIEMSYRGYLIQIRYIGGYFAHVFRPGASKPLSEYPYATNQEGEAICILRAKTLVDREERKDSDAAREANEKKN